MSQQKQSAGAARPFAIFDPAGLAEDGKKRFEAMTEMQTAFFEAVGEANKHWFEWAQSEAALASAFVGKLGGCRALPEAAAACQDWLGKHIELLAEDGRRVFADGQKIIETGTRMMNSAQANKDKAA
jgi:hypothetical protein